MSALHAPYNVASYRHNVATMGHGAGARGREAAIRDCRAALRTSLPHALAIGSVFAMVLPYDSVPDEARFVAGNASHDPVPMVKLNATTRLLGLLATDSLSPPSIRNAWKVGLRVLHDTIVLHAEGNDTAQTENQT